MSGGAPRLSPPKPARSRLSDYSAAAKLAKVKPMPWQLHAAEIITATGARDRWLYSEVCFVVSRQNGKSTILVPRIIQGLLAGERIMHTAQNRELPREIFGVVADIMTEKLAATLKGDPRRANGQEVIRTKTGGIYRIVAPTTAGARGYPNDTLIIDEVRELDTFKFVAAARPTLTASDNPQTIYCSNAGDDMSVVLNALRSRADSDPSLAYMEWSAAPERPVEDRTGWEEANPALGITIQMSTLEDFYRSMPLELFETEHLCRWVQSMAPRVISDIDWQRSAGPTGDPRAPKLGIAVDGERASAVLAWMRADNTVALTILADVHGKPLDVDALGALLRARVAELRVTAVAHDNATDRDLARYLPTSKAMNRTEWAAASERFARTVEGGRLRHAGADMVGADLAFTARKDLGESWIAVKAHESRPITAALAAIRAVWLATDPPSTARMY